MAELPAQDFAILDELHRSAGGSVYLGRHRRTGAHVILKERLKAELGRESSIAHELDLYAQLPRHRHLIECLGHFWKGAAGDGATAGRTSVEIGGGDNRSRDVIRSGNPRLVLVLEHAPLGDLHEFLQSRRSAGSAGFLDESIIWHLFSQIASAVGHLHAHSIVHRDLKALNVVLCADHAGDNGGQSAHTARREQFPQRRSHGEASTNTGDVASYRGVALRNLVAKICDLGVSRSRSDDTVYMQTFCGTPAYLAPELVGSQPYTERADVWSLGVILYELTAMRLPFYGRDLREVSELIARGRFAPLPDGYSGTLSALVASMLQLDLAKRPSAREVLHVALEQIDDEKGQTESAREVLQVAREQLHGPRGKTEPAREVLEVALAQMEGGTGKTEEVIQVALRRVDGARGEAGSARGVIQSARVQHEGDKGKAAPQVQVEASQQSRQTQDGRSGWERSPAEEGNGGVDGAEVRRAADMRGREQLPRAHRIGSGAPYSLEPTLPCATSIATWQSPAHQLRVGERGSGRARRGRGEVLAVEALPEDTAPALERAPNAMTPARPGAASDLQRDQIAAMAMAAAADAAAREAVVGANSGARDANYDRKRREFMARQQAGHAGREEGGGCSAGRNRPSCNAGFGACGSGSSNGDSPSHGRAAVAPRGANTGARPNEVGPGAAGREFEVWSNGELGAEVHDIAREAFFSGSSDGSVLSARDARLAHRLRDRDVCSLPSSRASSRPPSAPGIPLDREEARALSERQAQAYVLAQQMVAMHTAERSRQLKLIAHPKVEPPRTPTGGAMLPPKYPPPAVVATAGLPIWRPARPGSAAASRPGTRRPGSAASRGGSAAEGYDLITGAPLQSWRIR